MDLCLIFLLAPKLLLGEVGADGLPKLLAHTTADATRGDSELADVLGVCQHGDEYAQTRITCIRNGLFLGLQR